LKLSYEKEIISFFWNHFSFDRFVISERTTERLQFRTWSMPQFKSQPGNPGEGFGIYEKASVKQHPRLA
jgi:hypothetical protein